MRKLRWVLLFILLPFFSMSGQQVSGYINLNWVAGNTYQVTVTDYTVGDSQNSGSCDSVDIDTLRLYTNQYGTSSVLLTRSNGTGDSVCACRKANIYTCTYSFPFNGVYRVWFNAGPRVANINNLVNSSFQNMIIFNTMLLLGNTVSSPMITTPLLCTYGCPTKCYHFNLGLSPSNNVSYLLGPCLPGTGYFNPGATIDGYTGELTWCNPTVGLWNFSILIVTFADITLMGNQVTIPADTEEVELEVNIQNDCMLGVNEVKGDPDSYRDEKVKVYPNPSSGLFSVALSHAELVSASQTIEVYDVLGERVYNATLQPQTSKGTLSEINLSNQPNGIYFYRVLNEDGGLVGEGKLVVEH